MLSMIGVLIGTRATGGVIGFTITGFDGIFFAGTDFTVGFLFLFIAVIAPDLRNLSPSESVFWTPSDSDPSMDATSFGENS